MNDVERLSTLEVDGARVQAELDELATFSAMEAPAVMRVLFTEHDMAARRYVRELGEGEGLTARTDAVGNLFLRWEGSDPSLGAVGTGSHIDAIPNAGKYDGTVGVIGAIEAVRALRRTGFTPRRSLDVIPFTSEEPTRFGIGCIGSRALAGAIGVDVLARLTDPEGRAFDDVRRGVGFEGGLETVELPAGAYHAFVELHIEQGPLLEAAGAPIGAVTAIAAPASYRLVVEGVGGHAGGVLMADRRDALCAAAELVLATEGAARGTGSPDTVATVGELRPFPGAVNSIPSRVEFTLDLRDTQLETRDAAFASIAAAVSRVEAERAVRVRVETVNADAPATSASFIVDAVTAAAAAAGLACRPIVSRAYHDTLFMARHCPVGMIFIPSRGGVSHRPDEHTAVEEIAGGVHVLARTLATLSMT